MTRRLIENYHFARFPPRDIVFRASYTGQNNVNVKPGNFAFQIMTYNIAQYYTSLRDNRKLKLIQT